MRFSPARSFSFMRRQEASGRSCAGGLKGWAPWWSARQAPRKSAQWPVRPAAASPSTIPGRIGRLRFWKPQEAKKPTSSMIPSERIPSSSRSTARHPFGLVVLFGAASGPAPAIEPELLNKKGCLFLTRPSVFPHNADPATFRANAAVLFEAISSGLVKSAIGARFKLDKIGEAHRAAESRATQGATLIIP